eukprot:14113131-Alexandrium_andersonii.AAC.1
MRRSGGLPGRTHNRFQCPGLLGFKCLNVGLRDAQPRVGIVQQLRVQNGLRDFDAGRWGENTVWQNRLAKHTVCCPLGVRAFPYLKRGVTICCCDATHASLGAICTRACDL